MEAASVFEFENHFQFRAGLFTLSPMNTRALAFFGLMVFVGLSCKSKDDTGESSTATKQSKETNTQTLQVYSGRGEKLIGEVFKGFEEKHGVKLKIKYGDTATLAALLLEEGPKSSVDLFVAQDTSTLSYLDEKALFDVMPDALLEKVPKGMRSPLRTWVGLSGRARVLAYKDGLNEEDLPKSVDELTGKKWQGKVGWAPANASFQGFVAAMIALRGKEETKAWLLAMKANNPKEYPKNTPAVMAISRGEIEVALVNHYYLHRLKAEHGDDFPVKNHYFRSGKSGALVNLSGVAVMKTAKDKELAQSLVTYLLSAEGQKKVVERNHEFPVTIGATALKELPSLESLKAPVIDPVALNRLEETVKLLKETGVLI